MPRPLTTADIGIALRDLLEDRTIEALDWSHEDDPRIGSTSHAVEFVDVSDAHNPIIHTASGTFRCTITREG